MPITRTLILMRHAKSAYPGGVRDHDRPLANRGRHEARLAGQWLSAQCPTIEEVLCSTSTRTSQTLVETGLAAPVRRAAEIYDATAEEVLTQISSTDDAVRVLLVIGHAPAMPELALELVGGWDGAGADGAGSDGGSPDLDALDRLRARFPTSAIAVLESSTGWPDLHPGVARLVAFRIPRD